MGWSKKDLQSSQREHHLPEHDIFGAMFFHIRDLLIKFHRRISNLDITFTLSAKTAQEALVSKSLKPGMSFDRIDTSNIADEQWCGIRDTLKLGRQLNSENPNATLLTYFMRVLRTLDQTLLEAIAKITTQEWSGVAQQEIPVFDLAFQWIEFVRKFKNAAHAAGVMKKSRNTIIEWDPYERAHADTTLDPELEKEERFNRFESETYVEWRLCSAEEMLKNPRERSKDWNHDWVDRHNGVETELWYALKAWVCAIMRKK